MALPWRCGRRLARISPETCVVLVSTARHTCTAVDVGPPLVMRSCKLQIGITIRPTAVSRSGHDRRLRLCVISGRPQCAGPAVTKMRAEGPLPKSRRKCSSISLGNADAANKVAGEARTVNTAAQTPLLARPRETSQDK